MAKEFSVKTSERNQFVDVTGLLDQALRESGIKKGQVTAFVPHTTAAVTINENADPAVQSDILKKLESLIPQSDNYRHAEGNSDAHLKSSLFGSSEVVLVADGALLLGTWQGVFFAEFDGPRNRRLIVSVSGE